ncbi:hypothetical protein CEXT_769371 [Caerostris extrusa]|uniref:Bursicon n=1 Tax=Caerostris extrusa TaxID=172846 RepID=A0AAV4XF75_CAEEX|nr:hypothetical protein CEXT_769371 [Caerostris extrusa]
MLYQSSPITRRCRRCNVIQGSPITRSVEDAILSSSPITRRCRRCKCYASSPITRSVEDAMLSKVHLLRVHVKDEMLCNVHL